MEHAFSKPLNTTAPCKTKRQSSMPVRSLTSDVLIYTLSEMKQIDPNTRFSQMLLKEAVWVYERERLSLR